MDTEPRPWVYCPDELDPLLGNLERVCVAASGSWARVGRRLAVPSASSSPVAVETAQLQAALQAAPQGLLLACGVSGGQYIDAVGQLLQAIAALLQARQVTVGIWPEVRAGIELAGRVNWLLEPNDRLPGVTANQRAARYLMEMLADARRHRYTAKRSRGRGSAAEGCHRAITRRHHLTLSRRTARLERPGDEAQWNVGGETYSTLGATADAFVKRWLGDARGFYDVLSDLAHPSLLSLQRQSQQVDHENYREWIYVVAPQTIEWQVKLACLTFYRGAHLVVHYFGHPIDELESWADACSDAFPQWFRSTS